MPGALISAGPRAVEAATAPPAQVVVCACTYRRPAGLRALLEGIAAQRFARRRPRLTVIIADNEGSEAARATCAVFADRSDLPVRYVHEARRGITHARNTLLDNLPPDCELVAMIDDDEVPEPEWLERLLAAQAETGADVVHGPVVARLPEDTPAWLCEGGFFGWPRRSVEGRLRAWADRAELGSAATCNVLFRAAPVRRAGLRFDPRVALTGAEDALFFRALRGSGARIVWAADAVVHETIPQERARFGYLWRLAWRDGLCKHVKKRASKPAASSTRRALRLAARGLGECALGPLMPLVAATTGLSVRCKLAIAALRMTAGAGMIAGALGLRYEHYR